MSWQKNRSPTPKNNNNKHKQLLHLTNHIVKHMATIISISNSEYFSPKATTTKITINSIHINFTLDQNRKIIHMIITLAGSSKCIYNTNVGTHNGTSSISYTQAIVCHKHILIHHDQCHQQAHSTLLVIKKHIILSYPLTKP